jgi:hypothetical protein
MSSQFMRWDLVLLALIVGVPYGLIAIGGVRDWLSERAWLAEYHATHPNAPRHHHWVPKPDWWTHRYDGIK